MGKEKITDQAMYDFYGKMPLKRAIPLGLQHVLAMFVGNLTPLLIICGACGISGSEEFAHLQVCLLQNAMFVAGVVTLVQLYAIGPIGGKVPIIMGTSSGFIGVFKSVADTMGGGLATYGAIMGASILGGLFESVLGFFIKPLRKFFPAVVTGTVVLSIGLSLISVGINSFGGGSGAKDFGSMENLLLAIFVLVVILTVKHWTNGMASNSAILIGIIAGYIAAFVMSLVLPTTGITADGAEYTKAWVLNWDKVAQASWISIPEFLPVKPVFDRKYVTLLDYDPDVEKMRQAAAYLLGENDFASFCGNPRMKKSTVRLVDSITVVRQKDRIVFTFHGTGFLQNMVRILVGTLLEVGRGTRQPEDMPALLEARDRRLAGPTAPPEGLCLMKVDY